MVLTNGTLIYGAVVTSLSDVCLCYLQLVPSGAFTSNQDIYENGQEDTARHLPRGFPDTPSLEEMDIYWNTVKQITSIWPEYGNIRDIDVRSLK